ncbi:MAG: hydroxymethylglutaryl-CoA lyase [Bacillota bacterium]
MTKGENTVLRLPQAACITDVAGRDGFQMEKEFIPTEHKVKVLDMLTDSGMRKIEVTSFVHPKAVPQMRDAEEVLERIKRRPDVIYSCLVPNLRGAERALACKVDEVNVVLSVSETHNRRNVNMTVEESMAAVASVVELVRGAGRRANVSLATAFGCPYEGDVPVDRVLALIERCLAFGACSITLADTTGMANPTQVYRMAQLVMERWPDLCLTFHFHNTRGMGLANILAGLLSGVTSYDASLGGLGGCPFAPGATGNVCTEDVVHMLQEMGVNTGVDLDLLIEAARELERLLGRTLPGQVMKAGKRRCLIPVGDFSFKTEGVR